ncbi:MAG: T9SS type A sorting domain-containing protein [Cytophagales bacterium]|nr:T9SS type A sorting domain-containing protein [Cytophagales bacterium]
MALTYSIPSAWLVGEEHQQGRNTLGKVVHTATKPSHTPLELHLTHLPRGIYTVQATGTSGTYHCKLVLE